ncbi:MAG: nitrate/nitrite transporter NrtS [Candidatus Limnocylindrales bacterium]
MVRRALVTCLAVGVILTLINHGPDLLGAGIPADRWWQVALTFVVPFLVSMAASVAALRGHHAADEVEREAAEARFRAALQFPDQNPNPVLRVEDAGRLAYANAASRPIVRAWGIEVGDQVPAATMAGLRRICAGAPGQTIEVGTERRTFALSAVEAPGLGFINVYGTDVTAAKVLDKFPSLNPNPVIRTTEQGRLLYANAASGPVARAYGLEVGEQVPGELFERIVVAADSGERRAIEVKAEHQTFALLPVRFRELGFINTYGTDITATKLVARFPDENPNPVLRNTPDGTLTYANVASGPILDGLGLRIGDPLPGPLHTEIMALARDGKGGMVEVAASGRTFAVLPVWVPEFGFVNLYGTDITAVRQLENAHRENERLLLNILPEAIAARLKAGETVIADRFDDVSLLVADIVGFTELSGRMSPAEVVDFLNELYRLCDDLTERHGLEKIKTIGDAYMVVGGLDGVGGGGVRGGDGADHLRRVAEMALDLRDALAAAAISSRPGLRLRIGLSTGPAVAGVIGTKKFIYDVWGDTVNTAWRMESHGEPGMIHVTEEVFERLRSDYRFDARGVIDIKGKGLMPTYFLVGRAAQ